MAWLYMALWTSSQMLLFSRWSNSSSIALAHSTTFRPYMVRVYVLSSWRSNWVEHGNWSWSAVFTTLILIVRIIKELSSFFDYLDWVIMPLVLPSSQLCKRWVSWTMRFSISGFYSIVLSLLANEQLVSWTFANSLIVRPGYEVVTFDRITSILSTVRFFLRGEEDCFAISVSRTFWLLTWVKCISSL